MKKNILVIAAITSASFAIFNLGISSDSLSKRSDSTIALERLSEVRQNSDSQSGNEESGQQGYSGNDEDGDREEVTTSS
jgi:hypothetical protein